ncbi:hypothetical protein QWZ16_09630 [Vibrio ostreicida]|uniref:Uncharacterized protein n=1 Tax=Vibrio ostreicida TaxID=526588 RepID=A0ABT8BT53_9VIBR|nr:hypothetical protein [Vibrio ostreicida]MDN3609957.1 hypothetical protein [Vibrio ostreicida]
MASLPKLHTTYCLAGHYVREMLPIPITRLITPSPLIGENTFDGPYIAICD